MKDETIQNLLAKLMVGGVLLAAAVLLFGLVLYLPGHGNRPEGDKIFTGEPSYLTHFVPVIQHAFDSGSAGHHRAILQLGVLLLLLNPVVRVAFAAAGFAGQKDRLYFLISLVVLAALFVGFFG